MNISEVIKQIRSDWVESIMSQFQDLESKGLLKLEYGEVRLVHDEASNKIRLLDEIKVVLKDKEYIERLELENEELRDAFKQIGEVHAKHQLSEY